MNLSLQKANFGKRIIAGIFDGIFTGIIAVAVATVLSLLLGYDGYMSKLNETYERYEAEYEVDLQITRQEFDKLSEQEQAEYTERLEALNQALAEDGEAAYTYNMLINLSLIILSLSLLLGVVAIEFVVPLLFGNGQTLGKKIFGIGVINSELIKVNNVQLFVRAVLGKFAIELMIPVCIIIMIFFNSIGILGAFVLIGIIIVQAVCVAVSRTNSLLHDTLAGTVAVDLASQRIFDTAEKKIEYINKLQAEQAARKDY